MSYSEAEYNVVFERLEKNRKPGALDQIASDIVKLHRPDAALGIRIRQNSKPKSNERNNFQTGAAIPDAKQRKRPQALASSGERKAPRPGLRHCRFTLRRKKLLDVDAKYASVKDLLDSLAIAGIICGDKEGQITLEVEQEKIGSGDCEQTVIEVSA